MKTTELAQEKVQTFIQTLPTTLTQAAMSTYEMILEEGRKQGQALNLELLERERQRTLEAMQREEEERQRTLGAIQREEEERQRALIAIQREEEERQRLDGLILYLYETAQLSIEEIATLSNRDIPYIEALITPKEE